MDDTLTVVAGESERVDVLANDEATDGLRADITTAPPALRVEPRGNGVFDVHVAAQTTPGEQRVDYALSDGTTRVASATLVVQVVAPEPTPEEGPAPAASPTSPPSGAGRSSADPAVDPAPTDGTAAPEPGPAAAPSVQAPAAPPSTPPPADTGAPDATPSASSPPLVRPEPAVARVTSFEALAALLLAPTAVDDEAVARAGRAIAIDVLSNDVEVGGLTLTLAGARAPAHGTAIATGDTVTYTSNAEFEGNDIFEYALARGGAEVARATVRVVVLPMPSAVAVALDDEARTRPGSSVDIRVLGNDRGIYKEPTRDIDVDVVKVSDPGHGTADMSASSPYAFTYTPNSGFVGTDSFVYRLERAGAKLDTATVRISVAREPTGPVAVDDLFTCTTGKGIAVYVADNDQLEAYKVLDLDVPDETDHGRTTHETTQFFGYEPEAGFVGRDTFSYTLVLEPPTNIPGILATAPVTVTADVTILVLGPTANPDSATTAGPGAPVTIDVKANDDDAGPYGVTVLSESGPTYGSAVPAPDGSILYTPVPGFSGTDSFRYLLVDSEGGEIGPAARVTVVVPPPPAPQDDPVTIYPGDDTIAIDVLANDGSAAAGFTVTAPATTSHGSTTVSGGTVEYVPNSTAANVQDDFLYNLVSADGSIVGRAYVRVTIRPRSVANDDPDGLAQIRAVAGGSAVRIDVLANDVETAGRRVEIVSGNGPQHGTAVVAADGSISYVMNAGTTVFEDKFTYAIGHTSYDGRGRFIVEDDAVVTITRVLPPTAPTALTAAEGDARVLLAWQLPLDDGGSPVIDYVVTVNGAPTPLGTTTALSFLVDRLQNGTAYTFEVRARNAAGDGPPARTSALPFTVPDPPGPVTATPGDSAATVDWTAPASDGGRAITEYRVTLTAPGLPTQSAVVTGSPLSVTFTGLRNGTLYTATVAAVNAAGPGAPGSATVTPRTVPRAPVPLTATPQNGSLQLVWNAPANDGGSTVLGYRVRVAPTSSGPAPSPTSGAPCSTGYLPASARSLLVPSLTNGTAYDIEVVACNVAGDGPPATATATPRTVPTVPLDLAATAGNASTTVTWRPPASDGGSPLRGYRLTATPSSTSGGAAPLDAQVGPGVLRHVWTGLVNGVAYAFTVAAFNDAGDGPAASVNATPATVPGPPRNLRVVPGDDEATLSWEAPATDGGSTILGYRVRLSGTSEVRETLAGTTFTWDGLPPGSPASFVVSASNAVGEGPGAAVGPVVPGPPVLVDDVGYTTARRAVTLDVLANDARPGGFAFEVLDPGGRATAAPGRRARFTPGGPFGTATFRYRLSDGDLVDVSAGVTMREVRAVDDSAVLRPARRADLRVTGNDLVPSGVSVVISDGPEDGTAVVNGGSVAYTPRASFAGTDSFSYGLVAGGRLIDVALVRITVPSAQDDAARTAAGDAVVTAVTRNDIAAQGLTVVLRGQPSRGTAVVVGDRVRYTPDDGFSGTDRFRYGLRSGSSVLTTAEVTVTVVAPPPPESTVEDSGDTDEPGTPGTPGNPGTPGADDPDPAPPGTTPPGTTPPGAPGNPGTTPPGTGSRPDAVDDVGSVAPGEQVTLPVLQNDVDGAGNPLQGSVVIVGRPDVGTAAAAGGSVTYTAPADAHSRTVTFAYRVSDASGGSDTATVDVRLGPLVPVNAASAAPGGTVPISGDGCAPGEQVRVLVDGRPAQGTTADQNGSFTADVPAPTGIGPHEVRAVCADRAFEAGFSVVSTTSTTAMSGAAGAAAAGAIALLLAFYLLTGSGLAPRGAGAPARRRPTFRAAH
ncbi:Ig-like domain-containing protein [Motilibacter deserti]|uniref:Tandem-95 repeat protein n=1 Tax=Motilibacter deserti TaxID=2714956 RepID=A0ABX0GTE6_9ACTN|nr:tandem-95 repeat protein [Motilibacter deserti]